MKPNEEVTAQERADLVAWMLGEAAVDVRARVDAALLERPALKAERLRLERVVELLREHARSASGAEQVDGVGMNALIDAARASAAKRRGWRRIVRPLALAAAALFLAGLGLFSTGRLDPWLGETAPQSEMAASLDAPADAAKSALTAEQIKQLWALGYGGYGVVPGASEPSNSSSVDRGAPTHKGDGGTLDSPELAARLAPLGYVEDGAAVPMSKGLALARIQDMLAPFNGESSFDYFLRAFGSRPFESARRKPIATFAASVDTASYSHARAYLERGELPPADLVRTEAFINAFRGSYGDSGPQNGTFALHLELAPSPFGDVQRAPWLLRATAVARDVPRGERTPLALTFAVDVSGSMAPLNRLELVKSALELLVEELDSFDRVALVAYSSVARIILPMTHASDRGPLLEAIRGLASGGGTNLEGGLALAYQHAADHFDPAAGNRVVLLSDGVGNIGAVTREALLAGVGAQRAKGIYLNTIGVGMGDHNDALLDDLARTGDGIATYVDDEREARRAFVENFVGSFETVARDVKLQVEFDPARVGRWRLLGYESRALADRSFRDDSVDAGEVNAGHSVVALFELHDVSLQGPGALTTFRVRHKPPFGAPGADAPSEQAAVIRGSDALSAVASASPAFRLSAAVAQAAEMLRASPHREGAHTEAVVRELRAVAPLLRRGDLGEDPAAEPLALAERLERVGLYLDARARRGDDRRQHDLRFAHWELAVELEARGEPDPNRIRELRARIAELEAQQIGAPR